MISKNLIESEILELKRELPDSRKFAAELIAFANGRGGRLILGYDEKTHSVYGTYPDQRIEEKIANIISALITPRIQYAISYETIDSKTVLVIEVESGPAKPYHIKGSDYLSSSYVRVGSTSRLADKENLARLIREGKNIPFDSELISKSLNLSKQRIDHYFTTRQERLRAPLPKKLTGELEDLGFIKGKTPTITGALLLLDNPQAITELSQATIHCARFVGIKKGTFLDQLLIEGPLTDQIDQALSFVLRHINLRSALKGAKRIDTFEYPPNIVRELIANAVIHRDYSISGNTIKVAVYDDRIEVTSPGSLAGPATINNIRDRQYSRNPTIAKRMFELGYFESWGQGIDSIISWAERSGASLPIFKDEAQQFSVMLTKPTNSSSDKNQNNSLLEAKILEYLSTNSTISNRQCREITGATKSQVQVAFTDLLSAKKIISQGQGRSTVYRLHSRI